MARIDINGFEDVERQLLQRTERAAKAVPKMVREGAIVLASAQIEEIKSMFGKSDRSTGDLAKSIGCAPIKTNSTGTFTTVYPRGKDSKGVSNATKGFVLQYGRRRMIARPWFTSANEKAAPKVHEAMRKVWEESQDG